MTSLSTGGQTAEASAGIIRAIWLRESGSARQECLRVGIFLVPFPFEPRSIPLEVIILTHSEMVQHAALTTCPPCRHKDKGLRTLREGHQAPG